jgi:CrcB protein
MADGTLGRAALVAVGGAIGCVGRYYVGVWLTKDTGIPWGTLTVNLVGSFVIALFMFAGIERGAFGPDARVFFVTGVLGGFTTMSSFAYETTSFADSGEFYLAALYVGATVVGCLGAALVGRAVATVVP